MAREQYPDLIGLSPKKQLNGLPSMPKSKCGKRNKSCSVHGGGCGHRYKKGDKHWVCPECGADRRCWANHVKDRPACRMHGANAGRKPSKGFAIYHNLHDFNEILASSELLNNRMHLSALEAQIQDRIKEMTETDESGYLDDANKAAAMIAAGLQKGYQPRIQAGVDMLMEALAPLKNARENRREMCEVIRLANILKDSQIKWDLANAGMIPAVVVWEFIGLNQRLMFQFIPSANDRAAYQRELMSHIPAPPGSDASKPKTPK